MPALRPWSVPGLALVLAALAAAPASAAVPLLPDGQIASARGGAGPGGPVTEVAVSGSGRYAVFVTAAADLPGGAPDDNGTCDVYRRDLISRTTVLVSRVSGGAVGSACSSSARVSFDGRRIAFLTAAANLVDAAQAGAANGRVQALVATLGDAGVTGLELASRADGNAGAAATDDVEQLALSGDGESVAFTSSNAQAPGTSTGGVRQVWIRDTAATPRTTTLVSRADGAAGAASASPAGSPSVDQFGRRVAFVSAATLKAGQDSGGHQQVWVRDLPGGTTGVASGGGLGIADQDATAPALSADGRHVAFRSTATNLGNDLVGNDVFVHRIADGRLKLVSSRPVGDGSDTPADQPSGAPSISAHGDLIAFATAATNLGVGSPHGHQQVLLRRVEAGRLTLASPSNVGAGGGDADSVAPALAQGGIVVASLTAAGDVVPGGSGTTEAVVRRVRVSSPAPVHATRSETRDGVDGRWVAEQRRAGGNGFGVTGMALSGDGRTVAFTTTDDLNGDRDLIAPGISQTYLRDRSTGEVETVSRASDAGGVPGATLGRCVDYDRDPVALNGDGTVVAFCAGTQIHVRDRTTGVTEIVSRASDPAPGTPGAVGTGASIQPAISRNGRFVAFVSSSPNLVAGLPVPRLPYRVYLRDRQTGTTRLVDLPDGATDPAGAAQPTDGGADSEPPSVTDDGRYVAFVHQDGKLQAGNPSPPAGATRQAYVRDLQTGRTLALNRAADGVWASGIRTSNEVSLTPDGAFAIFSSNAAGLVPGATSTQGEVYRRRLTQNGAGDLTGPLVLVSVPDGPTPGAGGTFGNGGAARGRASDDGDSVVFHSSAQNYGTATGSSQVWLRKVTAAQTTVVSRATGGGGAPQTAGSTAYTPALSADASVVSWVSTGLLDGQDPGNQYKVFTRALAAPVAPPTNTAAPSQSPATPRLGVLSTCVPGTWTGGPTFAYVWRRDGAPIAGATLSSYTPVAADVGHALSCRVTGTNASGSAVATSAAPTVLDTAPDGGSVAVTGPPQFERTVTCAPTGFAGSATFAYSWLRVPAGGGTPVPIAGQTAATHAIVEPDLDGGLVCRVVATTTGGTATVTSPAVQPTTAEPQNVDPPRLEGSMQVGTVATCAVGTWTVRPTRPFAYSSRILHRRPSTISTGDVFDELVATPGGASILLTPSMLGWPLHCRSTAGTGGISGFAQGAERIVVAAPVSPPPPGNPGTPTTPTTPSPPSTPAFPRATSAPTLRKLTPHQEFRRVCFKGGYDAPLTGVTERFTWQLVQRYAGKTTIRDLRESDSIAGLQGAGQVATLRMFDAFNNVLRGYEEQGLIGIRCVHVLTRGSERLATPSAIVRPGMRLGPYPNTNVPGQLPLAVVSDTRPFLDDRPDVEAEGAPPVPPLPPSQPTYAVPSGSTFVATVAVTCRTVGGCVQNLQMTVATSVVRRSASSRAVAKKPAKVRSTRIAKARVRVKDGKTVKVRLRLTKAGARALRARKRLQTRVELVPKTGAKTVIARPSLRLKPR